MKLMLMLLLLICHLATAAQAANSETNFGGVGIDGTALADGRIRIVQLVNGGPAHLAGIRVGDIITNIDGKATQGSDFRSMVNRRLRGVAGTQVVIKIKRENDDRLQTFTLTRRQIAMIPPKEK
ncbi:MAG TPA: PDZ domain-containing protein [Desulfuromonadaceae bacterium]|jgi:C-terminal processing protease CtpA/Prc